MFFVRSSEDVLFMFFSYHQTNIANDAHAQWSSMDIQQSIITANVNVRTALTGLCMDCV